MKTDSIIKKLEKYVSELLDGKHEGTLAFRDEMYGALREIKAGKTASTISQDVRDAMERLGLNVRAKGIGWSIEALSKINFR